MDGTSSPHHRTITPPAPALVSPGRVERLRALFTSSSGGEHPILPQRKQSVRFRGSNGQIDGPVERLPEDGLREAEDLHSRSSSQPFSNDLNDISAHVNGTNGTQTIVRRKNSCKRHSIPQFDPEETDSSPIAEKDFATPSTNSSFTPSKHNAEWSPVSTISTGATSLSSPNSSGPSSRNRVNPDDKQNKSKSISGGVVEEGFLPPIQEDTGRLLVFPVQDEPIFATPSIVTVENVAAAKVYLETYFHDAMMEPCSPRAMRLKKLEQSMADLGLSHNERHRARQIWNQTESDHLREVRVLKASSADRHCRKSVSVAGFDNMRVLGKGSFGVVRLVTERAGNAVAIQNGKHGEKGMNGISNVDGTAKHNLPAGKPLSDVFAMKVIRKSEMLRACQEGHLRAERDFLVAAEGTRWVVPLISSFQDNTNLYLVMEYMIGGDFLGLLLREDVLDEMVAR